MEYVPKLRKPKLETKTALFSEEVQTTDQRLDAAEQALQLLINAKHFPAIKFFLETKGRDRGYGLQVAISRHYDQPEILEALKRKYTERVVEGSSEPIDLSDIVFPNKATNKNQSNN